MTIIILYHTLSLTWRHTTSFIILTSTLSEHHIYKRQELYFFLLAEGDRTQTPTFFQTIKSHEMSISKIIQL